VDLKLAEITQTIYSLVPQGLLAPSSMSCHGCTNHLSVDLSGVRFTDKVVLNIITTAFVLPNNGFASWVNN
jgi:hypothetical protein